MLRGGGGGGGGSEFQVWGACLVLGKDSDGIHRCVAQGPGLALGPRGSCRLPSTPLPSPSLMLGTQALGGSSWHLLPQRGQNDPPPRQGSGSSLKPAPRGAPLCSLPEPCASRAQDDRLPRCCLCWRHGPEARDPETQRYREGVREGERPGKEKVDRV